MTSVVLAALIMLAQPQTEKVEWTDEDTRKLEELHKEATRIYKEEKRRKKLIGKPGCPFEPGTYWNLDCA